jgi:lipopolysaccharide/colanic/teichoic acid biosynthesis glycosyltransferase
MLLMSVCQHLLRQPDPQAIWNDLNSVQSGVQMLAQISGSSVAASFFLGLLDPLFRRTRQLTEEYGASSHLWRDLRMRVGTILNVTHTFDPSSVVILMSQLIDILQIPDKM